jgi:hypothetical protein
MILHAQLLRFEAVFAYHLYIESVSPGTARFFCQVKRVTRYHVSARKTVDDAVSHIVSV